jgi:hypothetical protein
LSIPAGPDVELLWTGEVGAKFGGCSQKVGRTSKVADARNQQNGRARIGALNALF